MQQNSHVLKVRTERSHSSEYRQFEGYIWMALTMPPERPNIAISSTLSAFFTRNSCKTKEIVAQKHN